MTVIKLTKGKCDQCGFKGLLRDKDVILTDNITGASAVPTWLVCMTCFKTSAGMKSDNQLHKRLPEEEYQHGK